MALHLLIFTIFMVQESKGQLICHNSNVTCTDYDLVKIYWDLNGLHQDDPKLIEFIKENVLVPPDPLPLEMLGKPTAQRLKGQFEQVPMVEKLLRLKKTKMKGFFIEAGAACGEHLSNTLYLEMVYGWTGLLVEPNPDMLKRLYSKHRNSWVLPHCLSTQPVVEVVKFDASNYNSGIMLDDKVKPSHIGRDLSAKPPRDYERELQVQCFPLYSVLQALDNPNIDYFSLDIEGAEYVVLDTLPWDKVNMTLLSIETNHAGDIFPGTREDIKVFLEERGYDYKETVVIDDFFLHKDFHAVSKKKKKKKNRNKIEL